VTDGTSTVYHFSLPIESLPYPSIFNRGASHILKEMYIYTVL